MPYEGEILYYCPLDIDFSFTQAVVVSGASWNPCGHMLLCAGSNNKDNWYLQVAGQGVKELLGVYAYPKFMRGDAAYNRYLQENGKREIRRIDTKIKNPFGAYQKLMEFMNSKWLWAVLPHNCSTFTKEIIKAGNGDLTVLLNCPDQEVANKIIEDFNKIMDAEAKFLRENWGPKW